MLLRTSFALFVVAGAWAQQTRPATPPQKGDGPLTRSSFTAKGLQREDDLNDLFTGNFADVTFDRGSLIFSQLFETYLEAYWRHCSAFLPAREQGGDDHTGLRRSTCPHNPVRPAPAAATRLHVISHRQPGIRRSRFVRGQTRAGRNPGTQPVEGHRWHIEESPPGDRRWPNQRRHGRTCSHQRLWRCRHCGVSRKTWCSSPRGSSRFSSPARHRPRRALCLPAYSPTPTTTGWRRTW